MKDVFNKSIQYSLIDFPTEKGENERNGKSTIKLYIDEVSKALNTSKLVQKRVPVRQGNGKITYRMQWVKPGEDPVADKKPRKQELIVNKDKGAVSESNPYHKTQLEHNGNNINVETKKVMPTEDSGEPLTKQDIEAIGSWVDSSKASPAIQEALDKIKSYKGIIFRGSDTMEDNEIPKKGEIFKGHSLSSWSTEEDSALQYADGYRGSNRVLFKLTNNTKGKYISDLINSEYSEDEVLVGEECEYLVKESNMKDGLLTLEVEEVENTGENTGDSNDNSYRGKVSPGIENYIDTINELVTDQTYSESTDMSRRLNTFTYYSGSNWSSLSKELSLSNSNDTTVNDFVRGLRNNMLSKEVKYHEDDDYGGGGGSFDRYFAPLGSHPGILKHALITTMTKKNYNLVKSQLSEGNLTINMPEGNLEEVLKNGYVASAPEKYIKDNSIDDAEYKHNMEVYKKACDSTDGSNLDDILVNMSRSVYSGVIQRHFAERSMGLSINDDKPCYIAYNPAGRPEGGAPGYGDKSIVISDSELPWCTVSDNDSFFTGECVSKVHSMDHLQDLFILKTLHGLGEGDMDEQMKHFDPDGKWMYGGGQVELPLELQYHKTSISTKNISESK
jgi:hypothetical protein